MNAKECIRGRRSIRHYKDTPVPHEVLEEIIADAAYAPSWKNTQISRYVVVEGREAIDKLAAEYAPFNAKTVSTAPMLIVQTFIQNRSGYERDGSFTTDRGEGWQMYDAALPHRRCACPHMTTVSAPSLWVSSTAASWRSI